MSEILFEALDLRLAKTSAEMLKTFLAVARARAEDQETVDTLDGLSACRLTVTAVKTDLQIDLLAEIDGTARRIYAATFKEDSVLH